MHGRYYSGICVLALAWAFGCQSPATKPLRPDPTGRFAPERGISPRRTISRDFHGIDLADAVAEIAKRAGKNVVVDPDVQEVVTVSFDRIPWREALGVLAQLTRCEIEQKGEALYFTQPPIVTICIRDAAARTALQLVADYAGKKGVLLPAGFGRILNMNLKDLHWKEAIEVVLNKVGDYKVADFDEDVLRVVPR